MKVVYAGRDSKKRQDLLNQHPDLILLLPDNWDDFTYKTTFQTKCQIKGSAVEIGAQQILIENEKTSSACLDKLVADGWDGFFPIPNKHYVSVPESLSFYEQIDGHLDLDAAIEVARTLHDASFLAKIEEDDDALRLLATEGFKRSLQRERGAIKAYLDGWKLFGRKTISIGNQVFRFRKPDEKISDINLRFASASPLPHDINVLIGPNGVGKSQLLHQIVASWLQLDPDIPDGIGFHDRPNLSQVVVISYSPFELFPVDTSQDEKRKDRDVYHYFGLRGRMKSRTKNKYDSDKVILSREFPKTNAARSLIACLSDDQKYGAIKAWSNKLETMERVLKSAFSFDRAAVVVDGDTVVDSFFTTQEWITEPHLNGPAGDEDDPNRQVRYVPIASDRVDQLKTPVLAEHLQASLGVVFLKDGKPIHLSSGQRLFSYIVINILGAIRRNSLILVDEPELFLHPTLEITFIRMLKSILASYGSKALVATHSLVTVREIPRDCVHVFEQTDEGLTIKTPPFETFGGDVQRISSYVFGDKALSKPYEEWLRAQLQEFGTAANLIAALGDDINEELIIQIHAMEHGQW